MDSYNEVPIPTDGGAIQVRDNKFSIPDNPIIPFIEGDGTGPDIWRASRAVFDAAVQHAYGGRRRRTGGRSFARAPSRGRGTRQVHHSSNTRAC